MKKAALLVWMLILVDAARGQEFWLQPDRFSVATGGKVNIDFVEGEGFEGRYWQHTPSSIKKLAVINRLSTTDLSQSAKPTKGNNLIYTFNNSGTQVFVIETEGTMVTHTPDDFKQFISDYGLAEEGEEVDTNKGTRELRTRFSKLLIQAGEKPDDVCTKPAGVKLEIIPARNPFELTIGDYLECKFLYRGNPEPHKLVKVWSHVGNRIFLQNIYTESDGTIRFPISNDGPFMVSMVKMIPSHSPKADWESMWASLVFEIK